MVSYILGVSLILPTIFWDCWLPVLSFGLLVGFDVLFKLMLEDALLLCELEGLRDDDTWWCVVGPGFTTGLGGIGNGFWTGLLGPGRGSLVGFLVLETASLTIFSLFRSSWLGGGSGGCRMDDCGFTPSSMLNRRLANRSETTAIQREEINVNRFEFLSTVFCCEKAAF